MTPFAPVGVLPRTLTTSSGRKPAAPGGVDFVAGNHERFGDDSKYLRALAAAGVRVLDNEKVEVDGLQIIGVPYRNAVQDGQFAAVLLGLRLDRDRASILLTHAPDHPEIAEAAGISLQLPDMPTLGMARWIYRPFVYGLSRIGKMQVLPRAELERGDHRCDWDRIPRWSCLSSN